MPAITKSHSTSEKTSDKKPSQSGDTMAATKPPLTLDDIMQELRKGTSDSNTNFDRLEGKIDANLLTINNYIKSKDEAMLKLKSKVDKMDNRLKSSEDTVRTLEVRLSQLSDELTALTDRSTSQQLVIKHLEKANNDQILERKKQNLIIEGLTEKSDVNTKDAVVTLLSKIGVNA